MKQVKLSHAARSQYAGYLEEVVTAGALGGLLSTGSVIMVGMVLITGSGNQ